MRLKLVILVLVVVVVIYESYDIYRVTFLLVFCCNNIFLSFCLTWKI